MDENVLYTKVKKVCSPLCLRKKVSSSYPNKATVFWYFDAANFIFWMSAFLLLAAIAGLVFIATISGDDSTVIYNKPLADVVLPVTVLNVLGYVGCMVAVQKKSSKILYISSCVVCLAATIIIITVLCALGQVGGLDVREVLKTHRYGNRSEAVVTNWYYAAVVISIILEACTHYSLVWAARMLAVHWIIYPDEGMWVQEYGGGCHLRAMTLDTC